MDETNAEVFVLRDTKRPVILACTTLTMIVIIITSILVYFFTSVFISKIILWFLFSFLIFIGVSMILYVEYQKRQANKRKELGILQQLFQTPRKSNQRGWVRSMSTLEAQYIQPTPSAPKLSVSSGWALNPRKWSVATTAFIPSTPQPTNGTVI